MLAKKSRNTQHFNQSWLKENYFKSWLSTSKKGEDYAYCKYCLKDLAIGGGGKNDLVRHMKTNKHLASVPSSSKPVTDFFKKANIIDDDVKRGEILLASFVAEHNISMNVMEHLPQLIKTICKDSNIAKELACSRTKTTAIIKSVTGATEKENLIADLKTSKFSLLIDESTDRGCVKLLCVVVRYYKNKKIKDALFGLVPVQDATGEKLYEHLVRLFTENGIPYKHNMVGFAADGANAMMGQHNSVASRLLIDIPSLYVMKCICHSFALCASYACTKLPQEPEGLIRDVFNYISTSPKRSGVLREFQEFLALKPHKILHPCQTRWLSLHPAIMRILEQYEALKLFFTDASFSDRLISADSILRMLNNPYNKMYLEFMEYVLNFFTKLNKTMQSEKPQIHKLHENVCNTYKTYLDCYIDSAYLTDTEIQNIQHDNPRHYKPIEELYLGVNVATSLSAPNLNPSDVKLFKLRCLEFFVEGARQIKARYNFGNNITKSLEFLNPIVIKRRSIASLRHIAQDFPNIIPQENFQTLDNEWRHLKMNDNILDAIEEDPEIFWQQVFCAQDSDGNVLYPNLKQIVPALLCLPHSSAAVERIFSSINLLKTKTRNHLGTDTTEGLLLTKQLLNNKPCYKLNVENDLISKINKNMYNK